MKSQHEEGSHLFERVVPIDIGVAGLVDASGVTTPEMNMSKEETTDLLCFSSTDPFLTGKCLPSKAAQFQEDVWLSNFAFGENRFVAAKCIAAACAFSCRFSGESLTVMPI